MQLECSNWKHATALEYLYFNSVLLWLCPFQLFSPAQWACNLCPCPVTHQHSCDKEFVPGNSLTFKWELVQVEVSMKPRQGSIKTLSTCETGIRGWLKIKTVKLSNSNTLLLKRLYLSYSKVVFNVWTTSSLGVISWEMWKVTEKRTLSESLHLFFRDSCLKIKVC